MVRKYWNLRLPTCQSIQLDGNTNSALKRVMLHSALALATLTTSFATRPMEANATAIGYDYWGIHVFRDIPIPSGQLTGGVFGRGLYVSSAGGNFISAGNLCNWRIDVDFIDASGRRYDGVRGRTVENCRRAGQQKWRVRRNVRPGRACIRLYTAFTHRVASVCHNIVR